MSVRHERDVRVDERHQTGRDSLLARLVLQDRRPVDQPLADLLHLTALLLLDDDRPHVSTRTSAGRLRRPSPCPVGTLQTRCRLWGRPNEQVAPPRDDWAISLPAR